MSTTIGCPIPGASQPKEPVRLIDIKEVLQYDGAHFTWSGGKNCLSEQKAAYARGYDAGMKFIVDEAKKAPTIDPESLRPTAHWISVKDRPPEDHVAVFVFDSVCRNIYKAWMNHDLGEWFSEEYLPDFLNITHWMPLPEPPEVTP